MFSLAKKSLGSKICLVKFFGGRIIIVLLLSVPLCTACREQFLKLFSSLCAHQKLLENLVEKTSFASFRSQDVVKGAAVMQGRRRAQPVPGGCAQGHPQHVRPVEEEAAV